MADRLKNCIRNEDIIARIGGDEFIIIMPNIKQVMDSKHIANKILKAIEPSLITLPNDEIKLTLSIGLSIYPDDATDDSSLLNKADNAIYTAKSQGKKSLHYYDDKV